MFPSTGPPERMPTLELLNTRFKWMRPTAVNAVVVAIDDVPDDLTDRLDADAAGPAASHLAVDRVPHHAGGRAEAAAAPDANVEVVVDDVVAHHGDVGGR